MDLIDLSQGVPVYPTAPVIAAHVAKVVNDPATSRYAPRRGVPELRRLFAEEIARDYSGTVTEQQVLVTVGCNQAFCMALSALVTVGDEVVLPVPYYFNHDMWLRLNQIVPVHLDTTATDFVPDPAAIESLLTPRTKAITLVSPANPTGVTTPNHLLEDIAELAAQRNIALVLDETYRSFRRAPFPLHRLFRSSRWTDHLIGLYSFSKEYAIPGYRVGAVVGGTDIVDEVAKYQDCLAVCAPYVGQEAAIAGLRHAAAWRDNRVRHMANKLDRFRAIIAGTPGGFTLRTSGAFYAWVEHSYTDPTELVVRRLLREQGVLVLPGTAFMPTDRNFLRFSVAALGDDQFDDLRNRLIDFGRAARVSVSP